MPLRTVSVRVPATTANLGPGFDCLGVALKLYNTVTLVRNGGAAPTGMIAETAAHFFRSTKVRPFDFHTSIRGHVPMSRGLGSSVTVRLGVLQALNELAGQPWDADAVLAAGVDLEGHPDNAVPAFHGGFAACAETLYFTTPVQSRLKFIALIPEQPLETKAARRVLPRQVPLADAVHNLQRSSLITAAFASENYAVLPGLFGDTLHQPYRGKLLPCFAPVLAAAERAGALGAFLSGSGSTLMALALGETEKIKAAMLRAARRTGTTARAIVLTADNSGIRVLARR